MSDPEEALEEIRGILPAIAFALVIVLLIYFGGDGLFHWLVGSRLWPEGELLAT